MHFLKETLIDHVGRFTTTVFTHSHLLKWPSVVSWCSNIYKILKQNITSNTLTLLDCVSSFVGSIFFLCSTSKPRSFEQHLRHAAFFSSEFSFIKQGIVLSSGPETVFRNVNSAINFLREAEKVKCLLSHHSVLLQPHQRTPFWITFDFCMFV